MKKICAAILAVGAVVLLVACSSAVTGGKKDGAQSGPTSESAGPILAQHPPMSAQEKLRPCVECHKEVTPEIYTQWYNSRHGIDIVKCYQCHGTYEQMYKVPPVSQCAICHAGETMNNPSAQPCWDCHLEHTFKGH
ncbi:MAG: hypothetical protein WC913_04645 [Desulfuromonas sp.]